MVLLLHPPYPVGLVAVIDYSDPAAPKEVTRVTTENCMPNSVASYKVGCLGTVCMPNGHSC